MARSTPEISSLILIRSVLFLITFYLWSTLFALSISPLFLARRRTVVKALSVWAIGIRFLMRHVAGIRVEFRGLENLTRTGPALIAAKHQCMLETMGMWDQFDDACYVMKKELAVIPFFGWYALKGGMIVVDREAQAAALKKLLKDGKDRLADNRQIIIYPEGTRQAPGAEPDYKPGVAALYRELNLPCVPMATNSGVHWPAHGILRYPGTIVFEFLPAIPAGLKRGEFMREIETRIETASAALLKSGI
jgi:1-acyl-sn-glycerol-3-phosphate acyltransferase